MMRLLAYAVMAVCAQAAVVSRPVVNMYSGATEDTDVVSQAILGTRVEVMEGNSVWSEVRTPDGYSGWVKREALVEGRYGEDGRVAHVSGLFANVYREPSVTKYAPVMTLPFEARIEISGESGARWLKARLPDGREVWVQRGDVTFDAHKLTTTEMIELSRRFLGLPYLWGGTSTFGYDCSGFTQMLCRRRGIVMPRDAHLQAAWSGVTAVERQNLEPGDLLFFGEKPEKITHTGLYLGSGEFIHATTHERPVVQISRLEEEHWTRLLVAARRLK